MLRWFFKTGPGQYEMPRTMLRYAIERFAPARRRQYLEGGILPVQDSPKN